jgi:8-oxo-dGTP pyrophosphatase MutT (NUDIX family)
MDNIDGSKKLLWRSSLYNRSQNPHTSTLYKKKYPRIEKRIRKSYGVIIVRINDSSKKLEAVLVKGKYTYAFSEFVIGNHAKHNIEIIKKLIDEMTIVERTILLSLSFDYLWHYMWIGTNRNTNMYNKNKRHFTERWLRDGGKELKELISNSKSPVNEIRTEFPKGRRSPQDKSDLDCAIRETYEETNIGPDQYTIIPGIVKTISFTCLNINYYYTYYVGLANSNFPVEINMKNMYQFSEISAISWMNIADIKRKDVKQRLEKIIVPIFKQVRTYLRNKKHESIDESTDKSADELNDDC